MKATPLHLTCLIVMGVLAAACGGPTGDTTTSATESGPEPPATTQSIGLDEGGTSSSDTRNDPTPTATTTATTATATSGTTTSAMTTSTTTTSTAAPATTRPPTTTTTQAPRQPDAVSLTVDDFVFTVEAVRAKCTQLTITAPSGDTYREDERCFHRDISIRETPACLEYADDTGNDISAPDCELEAPELMYGRATGRVAYVCAVDWFEAGFGRPRFVNIGPSGLILFTIPADAHGVGPGHHFSDTGEIVGAFPLDAPSRPIYEMCGTLAPWAGGSSGPSDEMRYDIVDLVYRNEGIEENTGVEIVFDFGPEGQIAFVDDDWAWSGVQFIPFPLAPRVMVGDVDAALAPLAPIPNLDSRWNLVITVEPGAVTADGTGYTLDPERITLTWEEA